MKRRKRSTSAVADFVAEFNKRQKISIPERPSPEAIETVRRKYISMLDQESSEVKSGLDRGDLVNVAQELADVVYVCYGAASELGIPLDAVIEVIHENNLRKSGSRRSDGKVLKSPSGPAVNLRREISRVLRESGYQPNDSVV